MEDTGRVKIYSLGISWGLFFVFVCLFFVFLKPVFYMAEILKGENKTWPRKHAKNLFKADIQISQHFL